MSNTENNQLEERRADLLEIVKQYSEPIPNSGYMQTAVKDGEFGSLVAW